MTSRLRDKGHILSWVSSEGVASRPGLRISERGEGQSQFTELAEQAKKCRKCSHTIFFVDTLSGIMIFNQIVSPFERPSG